MGINPNRFPHIDLNEQSSRPGVDGPRYVEIPNQPSCLGDTNTGLTIHPRNPETSIHVHQYDDTQHRDMVAMVGNQVD